MQFTNILQLRGDKVKSYYIPSVHDPFLFVHGDSPGGSHALHFFLFNVGWKVDYSSVMRPAEDTIVCSDLRKMGYRAS